MRQLRSIQKLACWTFFSLLFGGCIELSTTQEGTGSGGWGSGGGGNGSGGNGGGGNGGVGGKNETATCEDGLKNGSETDIDCGGSDCPACSIGKQCANASDCNSGICQDERCVTASCNDNLKNGSETDTDCGGSDCQPCAAGLECKNNADCDSNVCMGEKCVEPPIFVGANVVPATIPSFTMSPPAGTAIGDLLVLFVIHGGAVDTIQPPSGWTEIQNGSTPKDDPRLDVFVTQYSGTMGYMFNKSASDGSAILAAFRGVKYGSKGAAENDLSVDIVTNVMSTFLFVSLTNNTGEVPAMPPEFTEIALGNGNGRSMRVSYSAPKPAGMYTLTAVAGPGDNIPDGTFAMSVH